ncbi:hypothetical protein MTO96_048507 [Rhipicephalus appendiculatus]
MTESCAFVTAQPKSAGCRNSTDVGIPATGVTVKVVDVSTRDKLGPHQIGEICFRMPSMVRGYYKRPRESAELFDEEGWCRSGDAGYYDEDGRFHICERLKQMIKCMGNQVFPSELEELLLRVHATQIAEVSVVGLSHDEYGEAPAAAIVLTEEGKKQDVSTLVTEIKNTVANAAPFDPGPPAFPSSPVDDLLLDLAGASASPSPAPGLPRRCRRSARHPQPEPASPSLELPPDNTYLLDDLARLLRAALREPPSDESWARCEDAWHRAVALATEAVNLPPVRAGRQRRQPNPANAEEIQRLYRRNRRRAVRLIFDGPSQMCAIPLQELQDYWGRTWSDRQADSTLLLQREPAAEGTTWLCISTCMGGVYIVDSLPKIENTKVNRPALARSLACA